METGVTKRGIVEFLCFVKNRLKNLNFTNFTHIFTNSRLFLGKNPFYCIWWGTTTANTTLKCGFVGVNSTIVLLFAHFNDLKDFSPTKKWGTSYPK